jgi:molecular chaperone GrpE
MDSQDAKPDGTVKVVDRRWWTTGEAGTAESSGSPRKPSYVEELELALAEKDKAIQAHAQRYRDSAAEFEQVRARLRRDVDKEIERARRAVLADLLDVVDNLDRALAAAEGTQRPGDSAGLAAGVRLVRDLFLAKLASHGVRPLEAHGLPFDASRHEAVSVVPVSDPAQDGLVVGVVRAGYAFGPDVLRPAAVAVGKLE